jgi:CheY-like chemotaxis protein
MPKGGPLTIDVTRMHIGTHEPTADPRLAPGNYVMITVRDSGIGMSPEDAAHAIEPFFTTKPHGKGSGLGLSMVYGFAKQSGGSILLRSMLGEGTSVSMLLPEAAQAISKDDAEPTGRHAPGGSGTILLVEDELRIRNVAKRTLLGLGYQVIEVENAAAAIKVLEAEAHVHLLFSDVVMPGDMNGHELAHWALQKCHGLKVLITTGQIEEAAAELPVNNGGFHLLKKPYTKEELAAAVRTVLDGFNLTRPTHPQALREDSPFPHGTSTPAPGYGSIPGVKMGGRERPGWSRSLQIEMAWESLRKGVRRLFVNSIDSDYRGSGLAYPSCAKAIRRCRGGRRWTTWGAKVTSALRPIFLL